MSHLTDFVAKVSEALGYHERLPHDIYRSIESSQLLKRTVDETVEFVRNPPPQAKWGAVPEELA